MYCRIKLFLFIIFISNFSFCQINKTVVVKYTQTTNFSISWQRNYELYANSEKSLYIEIQKDLESNNINKIIDSDEGTSNLIIYEPSKTTPEFYYNDLNGTNINVLENVFDELIYYEDTVVLKWKLWDNTKLIGDLVCNKATVNFRGRDYVAWYSKQIPISAGPLKFSGLNGLILEIESVDKQVHIIAHSLSYGLNKNLNIRDLTPEEIEPLNLREFLKKKDNIIDEYFRRQHAKQYGDLTSYVKCEDCREDGIEMYKE